MDRDVVIVGGGPAGLTTAIALARAAPALAGRIRVLEKERYPRDKYCAGAVGGRGVALLRKLDALPDVPFVPIEGMSFRGLQREISARAGTIGRVVRRIEFDDALARIAEKRGIAVEDGAKVERVSFTHRNAGGNTWVHTSTGEVRACVVVGADGVGSAVRRALGLGAGTLRAQALEVDTEPVPGDADRRLLHFDASDPGVSGYAWDFPTLIDGEPRVSRGAYVLRTARGAGDVRALLADRLARRGLDIDRYENKRYAERGYDKGEKVASSSAMLVGEAAGIDPITGEGIAQAIEYGVLAGRFLAAALSARPAAPDVSGWTRALRRSRLALDLLARRRLVHHFYGPRRPLLERFLLSDSHALRLGAAHFGATGYEPTRLATVGVRIAAYYAVVRWGASSSVAPSIGTA
jgi:flavin-dependent dehydrogenase